MKKKDYENKIFNQYLIIGILVFFVFGMSIKIFQLNGNIEDLIEVSNDAIIGWQDCIDLSKSPELKDIPCETKTILTYEDIKESCFTNEYNNTLCVSDELKVWNQQASIVIANNLIKETWRLEKTCSGKIQSITESSDTMIITPRAELK